MAITRIGTAAAGDGTTITIPAGHQNGDLIFIFAFRGATTAPTLGSGFTSISSTSSGASSMRIGYKIAISSADTSGTWTNATGLCVVVYRGVATNKTPPLVGQSVTTATNTVVNYPGINPLQESTSSWVIGFAATKTTDSALESPPNFMTNIATAVGAATEYALHDTNGAFTPTNVAQIGKYSANNVTVNGTSAEYRSGTIEMLPEIGLPNNYQSFKVGDGMSTTEKIR